VAWVIFWLYQEKWKSLKACLLSLILAFGLAAFFVIPAFFEKGLVQTEALMRAELDFRAQFVKVSQLFVDRSWNYSGSQPQSENTISYQIGWPLWWLVGIAFVVTAIIRKGKNILLFSLLFSVFGLGIIMTHNKSAPIWEFVKILSFVQFPWRFLSIVIFSGSLIGAYFVSFIKDKWILMVAYVIILLTVILNWQYFKPEHFYYDMTDKKLLSGQSFVDQQAGALLDYLPKTALEPRELAPLTPFVVEGSGLIKDFVNKSNRWEFNTELSKDSVIVVPVFDFPNWTVNVNGKTFQHSHKNILGRIQIELPKGSYRVEGQFKNSQTRNVANTLSLLSIGGLLLVIKYGKNRKILI